MEYFSNRLKPVPGKHSVPTIFLGNCGLYKHGFGGKVDGNEFKPVHSGKLTWQWRIPFFNREYIFKRSIFHCHVSLQEGTYFADGLVNRMGTNMWKTLLAQKPNCEHKGPTLFVRDKLYPAFMTVRAVPPGTT